MIIDDPEAFKAWLTAVLKPLCEADPGALAKYVFALVKKDKSEDVLRQSMISQLEVFLQKETENFVSLLFKTLDNKEYLTPVIPNANPPNPNLIKSIESTSPRKKEIIPLSELSSVTETINGSTTAPTINTKKEKEIEPPRKERDIKKSDSEKDERSRRRSRHRSSSRNRSRSRSWDRSRKSRSREKSRDRDREIYRTDREKRERARPYRNKSPPRRYDRRRSRTPSPGGKIRSRSRSPRHSYRGRYRNRSPPRSNSRSRSRSRSRSLDRKDRKESARVDNKEVKDPHSGAGTPTQDSNHGDMDMRLTNTTQSIQSVVVHQSSSDGRSQKKRCRDFDEKGYCMRGEMCQYDHGTDPVVLEDSALSSVLTYTSNTAPVADVPPIIAPPILATNSHPMMHPVHPRPLPPEYNPQAPQMWHRPGFRGPRPMLGPRVTPMGAFVPQQRELIPVPVLDNQAPDQFGNAYKRQMQYGGNGGTVGMGANMGHDNESHHDAVFKKKTFDYNRLGPRAKNSANCSLELKKVPPGLNNITHLNNHFSKFGKIVNIQVCYEGDPEAAIVTFSSHAEANAAYRSTEAVLNNRFIKVFWHTNTSNDGKQENVPPRSVKDRLGLPSTVPPNSNKVLNLVQPKASENGNGDNSQSVNALVDKSQQNNNNNTNSFTKNNVVVKKEENKAQIAAAIIKNQELLAAKEKLKKNQEEKRKEALKLTQDLRKRKQELLEKQLAQQKLLIDKMEKTPPGPARDLLKQTIKKSQESIEAIRKDMVSQSPTVSKIPATRKSKEEVQKEVLDAELDLIAKQQEGVDTSELQKKLLELKAKVALENKTRSSRGRRFNPVNRYLLTKNNMVDNSGLKGNVKSPATRATFQKHAVDHRPTRILVSGYEGDEQESLLTFFSQFGEIVDYVSDTATPSLVINYKIRKEAEIAMLKGKHFQDRTLSVTWCTSAQLNSQLSGRSSTRTVLLSESEEDQLIEQSLDNENETEQIGIELSEEVLLQDDEEEEEDNEGRSWRR